MSVYQVDSDTEGKGDITMPKEKDKPVHEVRLGRIKAVIWANEVEGGVRHNVQLRRLYKDGDNWEQSDTFGRDDLLLAAKVADLAHTWICERSQDKS
ncbi:MAG: hypothetical protein IT449_07350 [Phycisphaerales bacterium]|nr:hypothetical protein [Phycisphaerales bacterium]